MGAHAFSISLLIEEFGFWCGLHDQIFARSIPPEEDNDMEKFLY